MYQCGGGDSAMVHTRQVHHQNKTKKRKPCTCIMCFISHRLSPTRGLLLLLSRTASRRLLFGCSGWGTAIEKGQKHAKKQSLELWSHLSRMQSHAEQRICMMGVEHGYLQQQKPQVSQTPQAHSIAKLRILSNHSLPRTPAFPVTQIQANKVQHAS
jgi:hypothetical protein